ncbi:MAG: class I SAM-dependent methyltransferase [Bryobacteraceae bacterium]
MTSIDPCPRRDIGNYSDEIICHRVEELPDTAVFTSLSANDILFIDSSHEVKTGNDVVWLMLSVLPLLQRGVLIHFHDIFLPYEYPEEWVIRHRWAFNEQYLLQAFLFDNLEFETIWPGHYLEKSMPNFAAHFANWRGWAARSLWMRKRIDVLA